MSPEKQRIAIAEACGWVRGYTGVTFWVCDPHGFRRGWSCLPETADSALPDYLNDLNAMHEAEETLTAFQREAYSSVLFQVLPEEDGWVGTPRVPKDGEYIGWIEHPAHVTFGGLHATAAQRAEAFLRTIGKWEESDTP